MQNSIISHLDHRNGFLTGCLLPFLPCSNRLPYHSRRWKYTSDHVSFQLKIHQRLLLVFISQTRKALSKLWPGLCTCSLDLEQFSLSSSSHRRPILVLFDNRPHVAVSERSSLTSFLRLPPVVTLVSSSLFPSWNCHFSLLSRMSEGICCLVCNIYLAIVVMLFF